MCFGFSLFHDAKMKRRVGQFVSEAKNKMKNSTRTEIVGVVNELCRKFLTFEERKQTTWEN